MTASDGCFSYQLPIGNWYIALSPNNWYDVWDPVDDSVETTVIRNPEDQIRRRAR